MIPVWTPRALQDVRDVIEHIAADRMLARMLSVVDDTLVAHPHVGRPGRVTQTREFIVHASYILVYRVKDETLEFLAFRHSARRWPDDF